MLDYDDLALAEHDRAECEAADREAAMDALTDRVQREIERDVMACTELDDTTDRIVFVSDFARPELEGEVNDITIRFLTAEATAPAGIKQAILLLIGQWFDNRAAATDGPMIAAPNTVDALLCNHRSFSTE